MYRTKIKINLLQHKQKLGSIMGNRLKGGLGVMVFDLYIFY
jgi:hypothetical protein